MSEANEIIDVPAVAEVLLPTEPAPAPVTLFGSDQPHDVIKRAAAVATELAKVIEAQDMFSTITGRRHVRVEGWTLLGSMLGVFPVLEWSRRVEGGWEARCEARTLGGQVVGAAEAECLRSERNWSDRDDFALRSMAQTRAVSKALRLPLGFVVTMAGYEATPLEEMVEDGVVTPRAAPAPRPQAPAPAAKGEDDWKNKKYRRSDETINVGQANLIMARASNRGEKVGADPDVIIPMVLGAHGVEHRLDLPWKQMDSVLAAIESWDPPGANDPTPEPDGCDDVPF